jgi:hypothetical protein
MTDTKDLMLAYLRQHGELTGQALCDLVRVSTSTGFKHLRELLADDKVHKPRHGRFALGPHVAHRVESFFYNLVRTRPHAFWDVASLQKAYKDAHGRSWPKILVQHWMDEARRNGAIERVDIGKRNDLKPYYRWNPAHVEPADLADLLS